jgi:hypothetical protein
LVPLTIINGKRVGGLIQLKIRSLSMTAQDEEQIRFEAITEEHESRYWIAVWRDYTGEGSTESEAVDNLIIGLEYSEAAD